MRTPDAFRRLLEQPETHKHPLGFMEGDVAFVLTRDGLGGRRRADVYGNGNEN